MSGSIGHAANYPMLGQNVNFGSLCAAIHPNSSSSQKERKTFYIDVNTRARTEGRLEEFRDHCSNRNLTVNLTAIVPRSPSAQYNEPKVPLGHEYWLLSLGAPGHIRLISFAQALNDQPCATILTVPNVRISVGRLQASQSPHWSHSQSTTLLACNPMPQGFSCKGCLLE